MAISRTNILLISISVLLQLYDVCGQSDTTDVVSQLIERVEALERQGREQKSEVYQQQKQLGAHAKQLLDQRHQLTKVKTIVTLVGHIFQNRNDEDTTNEDYGITKDVTSLEVAAEYNHDLLNIIASIDDKKHKGNEHIRNTNERGQDEEKRLATNEQVAFHARYPAGEVKIKQGQRIVYPIVTTNLGASYHAFIGTFIAPHPGLYLFSTSILSSVNNHSEIHVHIMKNGAPIADAFVHGDNGRHDQGSVTIVTDLNTGDEVYVDVSDTQAYFWGSGCTSFIGVQLY